MNKSIKTMLDKIRKAVGECKAGEEEMLGELIAEAEGWRMRLDELAEEAKDEGAE